MSLQDYLPIRIEHDKFIVDNSVGYLDFPCFACKYRNGTDKEEPCISCSHNGRFKEPE